MNIADRLAKPGDPDLDCDVEGIHIASLARIDNDFLITLAGGSGRFVDSDTGEMARVEEVTHMEIVFGQTMEPGWEWVIEEITNRLEWWAEDQTALRFVAAPGRYGLLYEEGGAYVPIPRGGQQS